MTAHKRSYCLELAQEVRHELGEEEGQTVVVVEPEEVEAAPAPETDEAAVAACSPSLDLLRSVVVLDGFLPQTLL